VAAFQQLPRLTIEHDATQFTSGADELDAWLRESAFASQHSGNAAVFVATAGTRIVGYYALAAASVSNDPLLSPGAVRRQAPDPIPCLLIGRLAVDGEFHGHRIGRRLFQDALWRAERLSQEIEFRALLTHARDDAARSFYLHLTGSFRESPSDPHHLFLPLKNLRGLAQA